ncbi:MAG: four helix bundle protein [Acidobacteria bacterium]|nr:four helix bundle protein [Acidobacteriota bacterium]
MGTFKKFEDIVAWQKARELNLEIYRICGFGLFSKDFDLRNQIRRSSISIAANIAEGQGRRTDKDFAHFLNIALGSVAETKSHIYLALDLGYIDKTTFDELYIRLDEIGRMTFGLIQHLRNTNKTIEV